MALVKCKECGSEVSTKAKTCPKCGAKAPKKTSLFTWLVAVIVVVVMFNSFSSDPSSTSTTTANSNGSDDAEAPPAAPEWTTFESSDEMTGKRSSYAISPKTKSTREMGFPYSAVEARLAVGCDSESEWAYFYFTSAPNLSNTETQDGYNVIKTRVRWDDRVVTQTLYQDWGSKSVQFWHKDDAIREIQGAKSVLVELDWHGEGAVRFPFTLNGSSKALQEIRGKCAGY